MKEADWSQKLLLYGGTERSTFALAAHYSFFVILYPTFVGP